MFKKLLIVILSAALVMGLVSCGTETSADTEADTASAAAETEIVEIEATAAIAKERTAETVTRAKRTLDDIAMLSGVVTGITDREYIAGEGAAYKIHEDILYDRDIVYTVLTNTAAVRFDTPGIYNMTYWVYFDAAALTAWAGESGVSLEGWSDPDGTVIDVPDSGRLAVQVRANVTVTEDTEDETEEDAEDAKGTADDADGGASGSAESAASGGTSESTKSGNSGGSSKSASSGGSSSSPSNSSSSGSSNSNSSCDHNWVDEGHYESVLVTAAYDEKVSDGSAYVCGTCGYATKNSSEMDVHIVNKNSSCYHSWTTVKKQYTTVHHNAVYETKWVSSYKCSKCGATK